MGGKQYGIDETHLDAYAQQIKEVAQMGLQIGIVIGGGNIFRGVAPFLVSDILRVLLLVLFPSISLVALWVVG